MRPVARLTALAITAALGLAAAQAVAQTTATAPAPLSPPPAAATAPAPAPAVDVTQPFVGTVVADRVYVRSGPSANFYELGQLAKGDLVQVVGQKLGWYQIVPPSGAYAYVAKEFVEVDPSGQTGTVKGDYINIRGASPIHPNSDYAVLTTVRKGTKLAILGATEKYYKITPPERAYVFIAPQFVKAAPAGTAYAAAALKVPAGLVVPAIRPAPANTEPTTEPGGVIVVTPPAVPTTQETPTTQVAAPTPPTGPAVVVVTPRPAATYDPDIYARFNALGTKTQAELAKPVAEQNLAGLVGEYQALLDSPKLPPSVKQGAEERVKSLEKLQAVQNIVKGVNSPEDVALKERSDALRRQWQDQEKRIREYEMTAPPLAEGTLQASTTVAGTYVLVNPTTKRVAAYLDPASQIQLSRFVGEYIAVRGSLTQPEGKGVRVINVSSVTIAPPPSVSATQPGQ